MSEGKEQTRRDFRTAPLYLLSQLQRATRARWDDLLAERDLSITDYAAMSVVEALGEATNAELARRCYVTAQSMHQVVSTLVARRHFELVGSASARSQPVRLTADGQETLGRLRVLQRTVLVAMSGGDEVALKNFLILLKRFNDNLSRLC